MARLFLSYSRDDEPFARQVAASLAQLGADVWMDVEDIPAGMKWSSAIQEGLDICDALIVMISPESMKSRNVEDEWQYFLDQGKPVIPILYQPAKVHFQLSRIQYIDFQRQSYEKALRQLRSELKRKGITLQPIPGDEGYHPTLPMPVQMPLPIRGRNSRLVIGVTFGIMVLILGVVIVRAIFTPDPSLAFAEQTYTAEANVSATLIPTTPGLLNTASITPSPTLSVTPSRSATRTPRPGTFSPTELVLTDNAGVSSEETRIAQEETDQYRTENAPLFSTQEAMTLTAESYTATPTPNYRETAITRRTMTSVAGSQNAAATGTQMALVSPTPSLSPTPTPNSTPSTLACGNSPPSRLNLGMLAQVAIALPDEERENVNVRSTPGTNGESIALLTEGRTFYIVGGPECRGEPPTELRWWQIQTPDGTVIGWSAEGEDDTDYLMAPIQP